MNFIVKFFGSGFYTGYFPFASGTAASFVAFIIYYFIPDSDTFFISSILISFFVIFGIPAATIFENEYGKDPAECTVDEFAGSFISLFLIPKEINFLIIAFFLWRLLDILKPFPARKFEKFEGGTGIMLDDVVSGFYTNLIMQIIVRMIY